MYTVYLLQGKDNLALYNTHSRYIDYRTTGKGCDLCAIRVHHPESSHAVLNSTGATGLGYTEVEEEDPETSQDIRPRVWSDTPLRSTTAHYSMLKQMVLHQRP